MIRHGNTAVWGMPLMKKELYGSAGRTLLHHYSHRCDVL